MADIVVIAIVAILALIGWNSGLIKAIFHLGYYLISVVIALFLYPWLTGIVMASRFAVWLETEIIYPAIVNNAPVPALLRKAADAVASNTATGLTKVIISIICFVAAFIIVRIGLKFTVRLLDKIAKLPVLNIVNKVGGLAVGALNGVLVVYIALAIAAVFVNPDVVGFINRSTIASHMFNENILLKLLFG